jgi:hypothetical protein
MAIKKIATGNVRIAGKFINQENEEVKLTYGSNIPWEEIEGQEAFFSGMAAGDKGIKFGGTSTQAKPEDKENYGDWDIVSYRAGDGERAKVVHVPPGTKFTAVLVQYGDVESFGIMRIFIHEDEEDLKEFEYQMCLAALNKRFGK